MAAGQWVKVVGLAQPPHRKTPSAVPYNMLPNRGTGSGVTACTPTSSWTCCCPHSKPGGSSIPYCPVSPSYSLSPTDPKIQPPHPRPLYSPGKHPQLGQAGQHLGEGMGWVNPLLASHQPNAALTNSSRGEGWGQLCIHSFNCPVPPHPISPLSRASVSLCVPTCHCSSKEILVFSSFPSLRCFPDKQASFPIPAGPPQDLGQAHPASSISGTGGKGLGHKLSP